MLVFAKPPRAGVAKTRLAGRLGSEGAAAVARAFFEDTWASLAPDSAAHPGEGGGLARILVTTEPGAPEWRSLGIRDAWPQGDGDLGARLERALRRALVEAPAALAIGADAPGLPRSRWEAARRALETSDAVLGPSADGGFHLLGLRRCPEGLLAGLPWSAPETFARTLERLRQRGLTVEALAPWNDVDEAEDLDRLAGLLVRGAIVAPATHRALAALGALPSPPRISVILPVLDEARRIGAQLRALAALGPWHEILVVDGGSADRTPERAAEALAGMAAARVLGAPRGRGAQMNHGARAASGDVLLFLHADVELPAAAGRRIGEALADPRTVAGAFRTWTVPDPGSRRRWLAPLLHLGDLRSRYSGLPYGDQAIFARREVFLRVGGFPEQPLMEDLELSRRLRRAGRVRIVAERVRVSGRRFLDRPLYYFLLVNLLPLLYALGIPLERLARLYGNPR